VRRLALVDHAAAVDPGPADAIRSGLARLDAVVSDPASYVEGIRSGGPIENWGSFWDAYFTYELVRRNDGGWTPSTDRAACEEDMLNLQSPETLRARWRALRMPTLLVRCTKPLAGGLIVPQVELDRLRAAVPRLNLVEVDCNHYDVMTDARAIAAVADHLSTSTLSDVARRTRPREADDRVDARIGRSEAGRDRARIPRLA
jgi:pimeloyl-ACP methyl ester carboxylesterase